jgi:hypothetical protein
MLSALALSGPVAPAVPTSPPSTTAAAQSAPRESFKDVQSSVQGEDQSHRDAGSKPKTADSAGAKPKRSTGDGNDKTVVSPTPSQNGPVLQKSPLSFTFSLVGPELASQAASGESPIATEQGPQAPPQSAGDGSARTDVLNASLPAVTPGTVAAAAVVPAGEILAFSARLTQPEASTSQAQAPRVSVAQVTRSQSNNDARTTVDPASAPAGKDEYQTANLKKAATPEAVLPTREISSASAFDLRQAPMPQQPAQSVSTTPARSLAIQDVQTVLPEIPKPPASTEILLQLAGHDQSTASVRVVDRMGTVNVTVHAADPDLRSSLRSNLSDLASQLTGQGYKTEMVKPAVMAANADNQHDSRQSGQDSHGQQQHQFTPDGRQPQRERRANSEQWRDELEQEASGTSGAPGGKS